MSEFLDEMRLIVVAAAVHDVVPMDFFGLLNLGQHSLEFDGAQVSFRRGADVLFKKMDEMLVAKSCLCLNIGDGEQLWALVNAPECIAHHRMRF